MLPGALPGCHLCRDNAPPDTLLCFEHAGALFASLGYDLSGFPVAS